MRSLVGGCGVVPGAQELRRATFDILLWGSRQPCAGRVLGVLYEDVQSIDWLLVRDHLLLEMRREDALR